MLDPSLDLLPHCANAEIVWISRGGLLMDFPRIGTENVRYFAEIGRLHDKLGKGGKGERGEAHVGKLQKLIRRRGDVLGQPGRVES
jgi:hypothetical protein